MASNPELCLSVDGVEGQVPALDPRSRRRRRCSTRTSCSTSGRCTATRRSATRCAHGCSAIRRRIPRSFGCMVQNALDVDPPLGLIRAFTVDDDPGVKGTLDLKTRGTRLFVDCARVFALAHGIAGDRDGGTPALSPASGCTSSSGTCDATVEAFHFLQLLRLRQQEQPRGAGQSQPHRSVRAARDRPADAEGGVPAGEAAAGAVAHVVSAVTGRSDAAYSSAGEGIAREGAPDEARVGVPRASAWSPCSLLGVAAVQLSRCWRCSTAPRRRSASRCSTPTSSAPGRC